MTSNPKAPIPEQTRGFSGTCASMQPSPDHVEKTWSARSGQDTPMKRPAHPVGLAAAYVLLAEPMSSYVSGATVAVTGGVPMV